MFNWLKKKRKKEILDELKPIHNKISKNINNLKKKADFKEIKHINKRLNNMERTLMTLIEQQNCQIVSVNDKQEMAEKTKIPVTIKAKETIKANLPKRLILKMIADLMLNNNPDKEIHKIMSEKCDVSSRTLYRYMKKVRDKLNLNENVFIVSNNDNNKESGEDSDKKDKEEKKEEEIIIKNSPEDTGD